MTMIYIAPHLKSKAQEGLLAILKLPSKPQLYVVGFFPPRDHVILET